MKKRSEGFFGLHFDFHAGADCVEVGKTVTEEMVREIIETLQPDYIQCDCKGHRGYTSYPTKAGNPAPGFAKDLLAIWRKVTREFDIPLVVHYSGVWDTRALELHPEWAATNEDGARSKDMTSTFKGYADGLFIPQLVELVNDYGVDAVWVDGDCWATVPDFDEKIIASFEAQHGVKLSKDSEGKYDKRSPAFRAFLDFCRRQFFNYLSHYVDAVHAKTKNFEIASNWAFSSHIPQPVCVNVDYLSGDFASADSYNSARFEARVLCEQGMPWDLMAWGFYHDFTERSPFSIKGPEALCREAASVISLGGGFQIYNTQNRDGSVRLWEVRELKPVAKFVRDREPFLKGSKPFADIGVLYSDHDMRGKSDSLFFGGGNDAARGAIRLLLDAARPCGILMDHTLTPENLSAKKIIVLPELQHVRPDIKSALLGFTANGGTLVLSGVACCKAFGVAFSGESKQELVRVEHNGRRIGQYANVAEAVVSGEVLKACGFTRGGPADKPAVVRAKHGKGGIVAICYDLFETYFHAPDFYVRNMMAEILDGLDAGKFITYAGPKFADIVPSRKDGKLLINLTNTSGIYSEARLRAYDEIAPLHDLEIRVKCDKPASVMLQPENKIPQHCYDAASRTLTVKIERLHIHTIVVIGVV